MDLTSISEAEIPWFVTALFVATGLMLIGLAIPLWKRRVPPNWAYGVRLPSTFADKHVWYEVNARGGRDLVIIAVGYLCSVGIAWKFGEGWPTMVRVLGPVALLMLALIVETVILARLGARMLSARRSG